MTDQHNVWFRLGYALESARPSNKLAKDRAGEEGLLRNPFSKQEKSDGTILDTLLTAGAGAVVLKTLSGASRPGPLGLAHAAAAGAAAAMTRSLVRAALNLGPDALAADPARGVLEGAARGLLYGAAFEPHIPGSPSTCGVAFGALEYAVAPWGGLDEVLGAASPRRTMPVLGALMSLEKAPSESFTDHLIFGVTLGLLYGLGRARSGSREAV